LVNAIARSKIYKRVKQVLNHQFTDRMN